MLCDVLWATFGFFIGLVEFSMSVLDKALFFIYLNHDRPNFDHFRSNRWRTREQGCLDTSTLARQKSVEKQRAARWVLKTGGDIAWKENGAAGYSRRMRIFGSCEWARRHILRASQTVRMRRQQLEHLLTKTSNTAAVVRRALFVCASCDFSSHLIPMFAGHPHGSCSIACS